MKNLTAVCTNDTITLRYDSIPIMVHRDKNQNLFDILIGRISNNDLDWVVDNFKSISEEISNSISNLIGNDEWGITLKGSNIPVPQVILKQLKQFEKLNDQKNLIALLRFWRKLEQNPSENSRNDLYDFMLRNNIPLTEEGDIVVEKGVNHKQGSFPGHLVDCKTGKIDNSVGVEVSMSRENVNPDSNVNCSYGLHVGAPQYVRNHWTSDIIVECIVNPIDVVSVPKDYNATKMRVCRYKVMGYSNKSRTSEKIISLDDFLSTPTDEQLKIIENKSNKNLQKTNTHKKIDNVKVTPIKYDYKPSDWDVRLSTMTAKQMVDFVKEETGETITFSLKSKKSIKKKAVELLTLSYEKLLLEQNINYEPISNISKEIDLNSMSTDDLVVFAKKKFNEDLKPSLGRYVILLFLTISCKNAGYKIINDIYLGNRSIEEIDYQIQGLLNDKVNLPEYSLFGDKNWETIDAWISYLKGALTEDDFSDEEFDEYDLEIVDDFLWHNVDEDLFENWN